MEPMQAAGMPGLGRGTGEHLAPNGNSKTTTRDGNNNSNGIGRAYGPQQGGARAGILANSGWIHKLHYNNSLII